MPPPSCAGEEDAPHTSQPCFFFLACASALLGWRRGRSAHVTTLLFLFGVYRRPLGLAKRSAPHTSFPCFFFLACASALLQRRLGFSAHVKTLLFLFGVCLRPLTTATWLFPHTSQPCFSFLACASALSQRRLGFSAHVIILLFLFGVCLRPLGLAKWSLRTRHNLAFSFWRVPAFSWAGKMAAPHTSFPCFFFLACAKVLLGWQNGCSAHVTTLLFLFDVCLRPLATAKGLFRTRHNLAFSF